MLVIVHAWVIYYTQIVSYRYTELERKKKKYNKHTEKQKSQSKCGA